MTETQQTINDWQKATFPDASPVGILGHLTEEWAEFQRSAGLLFESNQPEDFKAASFEAADLVILLLAWAGQYEIDLWHCVELKMAINRARRWSIQPDGTGRHTRSGQDES